MIGVLLTTGMEGSYFFKMFSFHLVLYFAQSPCFLKAYTGTVFQMALIPFGVTPFSLPGEGIQRTGTFL